MSAGSNLLLDQVRAATGDEYTIEGELGRGGMAAVFLARDMALDRRVAIKVMLPDLVDVAGFQDRFVTEARTAAHLDHPGIVTVYAVKQRAGLTYIVMKYIEGRTLDHVLTERGALEPDVVATIGSRVAEALHFAHGAGVIHRDVKPSNIIIDSHGRPVVTDFGIAKVATGPSITVVGSTLGTPAYMSPEQCRGLPATGASDQYSLGVMLYEMVTGRPPFSGNLFELLSAHAAEEPPSISDAKADVDPGLDSTIMRMLAKDPNHRFTTLGEAAKTLSSRAPRRSQAAEMQAIIAAIAPERTEWLQAVSATTEGMSRAAPAKEPGEFTREFGILSSASVQPYVPPPPPVQAMVPTNIIPKPVEAEPPRVVEAAQPAIDAPSSPPPVEGIAAPTSSGSSRKLLIGGAIAALIVAAAVYALVLNRPKSQQPPALVQQSVPAVKTDSVAATKPDTGPAPKPDSTPVTASVTPPPVTAPAVATTPAQKTAERPKNEPKAAPPPSAAPKARSDSLSARCSALNLKMSLGEELTRADSSLLRRCARATP